MAAELRAEGVDLLLGRQVMRIHRSNGISTLVTTGGDVSARRVITCAGLQADKVAGMSGPPPIQIVPFRGDYYTLRPDARYLCRGLIYPVPDPSLPFLGVHFTKRTNGDVWAGPNAVLATAREGYGRTHVKPSELFETLRYPGFRKLARRYWRTGAHEMWRDVSKRAFTRELQRYVPAVTPDQLVFGPSGVRAQALEPDGAMVDDFRTLADSGAMHVLNAPSPAATASLAIAGHLADEAKTLFDLDAV